MTRRTIWIVAGHGGEIRSQKRKQNILHYLKHDHIFQDLDLDTYFGEGTIDRLDYSGVRVICDHLGMTKAKDRRSACYNECIVGVCGS